MPRIIVIGDIHGCFDELQELLRQIDLQINDRIIALGDIIDKGNKSKEVYGFLRNRPNTQVIIGNHERKHINQFFSYSQEIVKVQFGEEYPAFLAWLQTLDYYVELPQAYIIHAGMTHDTPINDQKDEVLCGSTAGERFLEKKYGEGTYWTDYYTNEKPAIYGHHVVGENPHIKNNTIGIDTGACHGDYLTAIVFDEQVENLTIRAIPENIFEGFSDEVFSKKSSKKPFKKFPFFEIFKVKSKMDYWKDEQKKWQIPVLKAKDWGNMEFVNIDQMLQKLDYIQEIDIRQYIQELMNWKNNIFNLLPNIKENIENICKKLKEELQDNFTKEIQHHPLKVYLFKALNQNLKLEDLVKTLNTPNKILNLTEILKI